MTRSLLQVARTVGLTLFLAHPVFAQGLPSLSPLPLKGTLGDIPSAPIPRDQNGDPIPPKPATAEELEFARREHELRVEKLRAEEERLAAEARRAADESRTTELLAEEHRFHDRIMKAVYVGLAIVTVGVGLQFFKRK